MPAFAGCDADDLLAQIHAWREADATRGDLRGALGRVQARVLLMPCTTDKYFTVEEVRGAASTRAALRSARTLLMRSRHRRAPPPLGRRGARPRRSATA